jgi:hypothetical protein
MSEHNPWRDAPQDPPDRPLDPPEEKDWGELVETVRDIVKTTDELRKLGFCRKQGE